MMTRFFVKHPVTTWMIFSVFIVLAIYAVPRIEVGALPDVDLPSLTVYTSWPGASPMAIQRSLTLPVEEAVRNVHGVESVKSTSRPGNSAVEVEFRRDIDLDFARLELNEQLGDVRRTLPAGASQPIIQAFVPEDFQTEQFFSFSIESPLPPNELRDKAETWIAPRILSIDGVADATVRGGALPLLKIQLDRKRLVLHDISADEVYNSIRSLDDLSGAGAIRENGFEKLVALRDPMDIDRLRSAVVARRGGVNFSVDMLGKVVPAFDDPLYFVRLNGNNVVEILVEKRSGTNSVSVSRNLRRELPRLEADLPFEAVFHIDEDEGQDLEDDLKELVLRSVVILAILFILLVISLRQVRLTAIVIGSILFAIVMCLSLFYFLKLSVNFITISGLTICFGMLLDNSILVLDSIHRRLRALDRAEERGLSWASKAKVALRTIVSGTGEVIFPIMATTLTTIVAFLSFIFLTGRLALYYVPLAVTIALAMFASIFVAFGWIPVVLNQAWAAPLIRRSHDGPNELQDEDALDEIVEELPDLERPLGIRERIFDWVQRLWWVLVPGLVALCIWSGVVYDKNVIKGGFWNPPDDEKITFFMRMPEGTDVRVTSETLKKFEDLIVPVDEGANMRANAFNNIGFMEIEFDDETKLTGIPLLYRNLLVELADRTGGTSIFIAGFSDQPYFKGSMRGSALNSLVKVTGYNSKRLNRIADDTVRTVSRQRRVRQARVTSSERFGPTNLEETVINLRREVLAAKGLTVLEVVAYVRRLLGVEQQEFLQLGGEQERFQLSYLDSEDIEFSEIADKVIESSSGEKVRLGDLLTMETVPLSTTITREDQKYSTYVNWEYVGTDRMRRSYIKNVVDSMDLPYGYGAEEAERQELTDEEEEELRLTLILALAFIFMVMAALFESIALPVLVLLSVPMALVGVVLTYWLSNTAFDSSAKIGLVLLFGIVVNNAILLVSRFRSESALVLKARLGGDPCAEAALFPEESKHLGGSDLWLLPAKERAGLLRRAVARGTLVRMRSVLLTSGTTVVGLVPLLVRFQMVPTEVLGVEIPFTLSWMDSENQQNIWENLALSSIGGLLSSTVLLLLMMPALYYFGIRTRWILQRFGGWLMRRIRRRPETPADAEPVAG